MLIYRFQYISICIQIQMVFKRRQHPEPRRYARNRNYCQGFELKEVISNKTRYGKIYKATHHDDNKQFAALVLNANHIKNNKFLQQSFLLLNNGQVLGDKYFPSWKTLMKTPNNFYIFIQFYSGGTLRRIINQNVSQSKTAAEEFVIMILKQMIRACKILKRQQLTYDCLQSGDIMLNENKRVKIIGHPLYKDKYFYYPKIDNKSEYCRHSEYRAPEKLIAFMNNKVVDNSSSLDEKQYDENKRINQKTQIWSVGVILYELLYNHKPFSLQEYTLLTLQYGECKKVGKQFLFSLKFDQQFNISEGMKTILKKMIVFDKDKRSSWEQIKQMIKKILLQQDKTDIGQELSKPMQEKCQQCDKTNQIIRERCLPSNENIKNNSLLPSVTQKGQQIVKKYFIKNQIKVNFSYSNRIDVTSDK